MIRGAAKNHAHVAVVTDPAPVRPGAGRAAARRTGRCRTTRASAWPPRPSGAPRSTTRPSRPTSATRARRGGRARRRRAFPSASPVEGALVQSLRYGENPHQAAAFYRPAAGALGLSAATQLHGPELSLQQPARLVGRARAAARVRRSGRGGDQAHQPVRRRPRPERGRGDAPGQGLRPGLDLRRHRGGEPDGGPRGGEGAVRHPARDPVRARLRAGRARGDPPDQEEVPRVPAPVRARATTRRGMQEVRSVLGRRAAPGRRPHRPRPGRAQGGLAAGADRGGAAPRCASRWRVAKHAKSNAIVLATARAGGRAWAPGR